MPREASHGERAIAALPPSVLARSRGAGSRLMVVRRTRPSREILSGESADVYFARADRILEREGLDPVVTMEVFARREALLCGIDEVKNLLAHALASADPSETTVEALDDGDAIAPKEVALRITARSGPSACTRPPSLGCSPSRPAGRPPRGRSWWRRRPSR